MDNISLKSGLIYTFLTEVEKDEFPRGVKDRGISLPLPELDVERSVHLLDVRAVSHHREIAALSFNHNDLHAPIIQ